MATVLKTFTAHSATEALKKAKQEYGDNVMIVTTKQIRPKTLNKEPLYEILASVEESEKVVNLKDVESSKNINEITEQIRAYTKPSNLPKNDDSVLVNISKQALAISQAANISQDTNIDERYAKKIEDIAKQVNKLDNKVSMIGDMIWDDRSDARGDISIPPEFSTIYKLAKQSGMENEHLKAIMQTTIQNMPTSMKTNPVAVKRYFYSLLRNMLPCRNEVLESKKQRIMMFVGPTGVGKTTTLSKLAYKFAYSGNIRYKTGIITLDIYRLGAVEQLFQYAKIMALPILDAIEIEDFRSALKSLSSCDLILVDTMGNSQYDRNKLTRLNSFLKECGAKIDVNLVVSAGSKIEDLLEIYSNFSFLDIDTLIVTKLDETKIFGNVFSLVYETNTPVSFFSIGQAVPEDIVEAKSEFLVQCVLEGFDKEAIYGPSR